MLITVVKLFTTVLLETSFPCDSVNKTEKKRREKTGHKQAYLATNRDQLERMDELTFHFLPYFVRAVVDLFMSLTEWDGGIIVFM